MPYADSIPRVVYEAFVEPRKGFAAAKRDYWYERYVSDLEERGVDEVDLELTFPDAENINPFFYVPRFHVVLSPHGTEFEGGTDEEGGSWRQVLSKFVPRRLGAFRRLLRSDVLEMPVHGSQPRSAYENASDLYERWLGDLEERGFAVHRDYEFPRGLQDAIGEEDRRPW